MALDRVEFDRWRRTADEHLRAARHSQGGELHSATVLFAEQAAQCALKALLLAVGRRDVARGHVLVAIAAFAQELAGLVVDEPFAEALARLSRAYQPSRYPDALPAGTPEEYFGRSDSTEALATAQRTLDVVDEAWRGLLEADEEDDDDDADCEAGGRPPTS